ncbi:TIR domain-containing protein [Croceibacterium salegens]|uniref:TIR domain-containing protein n=1 Tax=Croceibacterium salegens TaxID=1737568 RepID=UPI00135B42E1|nr:TIR domain-containing protein [Croceibacterium salegens]
MAAPDIFLSYNREDAARAKHFADGFAAEGLEVWWDVALRSGEAYDEVTEAALRNARAVVVLWSKKSVVSRWVRAEATLAERNKTLIPVTIEQCDRPIMFELVQTAELAHWQGDPGDPAWRTFAGHVRDFVGKGSAATAQPVGTAPDQVSIAVLPFANMSDDAEQEYFADGISEDIITDLSKVSALFVIARNTAFTFKGKHVDIKDVARQFGVTHVLEGSVRKAGNRVRVTAQLIDGATGGHVWAERYDRELADIFEIQDELSEAIVGALKVRLLPSEKREIENRGTRNAEAYDHYIRARALRASMDFGNLAKATDAYRDAVRIDPAFASAWAGLATIQQNLGLFTRPTEAERAEITRSYARAVQLGPDQPDVAALRLLRSANAFDWPAVEEGIAYFVERGDNNWSVVSHAMLALGRAQEAVEQQSKVVRSDPLSLGGSYVLQHNLSCAGRLEEADREFERCHEIHPTASATVWQALVRAMATRDHDRVFGLYASQLGSGMEQRQPYARDLVAVKDDPAAALEVIREALTDPQLQFPLHLTSLAHWFAYYGDDETVLAIFREGPSSEQPLHFMQEHWQPGFARVRQSTGFKDLLRDAGLADYWRATDRWGEFARPVGEDDFEIIA